MSFDAEYLGRFQQGEELPLSLQCTDGNGSPADPAADPVVTVYRDAGGTLTHVKTVKLAAYDRGSGVGLFRLPLFLGTLFSTPARHVVVYRWQVGSAGYSRVGCFNLIPGGSQDGAAIAMSFVARPDANHLVTQTDSGQLVRGRNPR